MQNDQVAKMKFFCNIAYQNASISYIIILIVQ